MFPFTLATESQTHAQSRICPPVLALTFMIKSAFLGRATLLSFFEMRHTVTDFTVRGDGTPWKGNTKFRSQLRRQGGWTEDRVFNLFSPGLEVLLDARQAIVLGKIQSTKSQGWFLCRWNVEKKKKPQNLIIFYSTRKLHKIHISVFINSLLEHSHSHSCGF